MFINHLQKNKEVIVKYTNPERLKKKLQKIIQKKILKPVKLFLHSGNKYICPFCNYSSKDLSPVGHDVIVLREKQVIGGTRRFCGCYKCGSRDRERLIYVYLKEVIKFLVQSLIL